MANLLVDHETRYVYPFKSVATLAYKIGNNTHLEYVNKPIETYILLGYSVGIVRRKGNKWRFGKKNNDWFEDVFTIVLNVSSVSIEYPIPF